MRSGLSLFMPVLLSSLWGQQLSAFECESPNWVKEDFENKTLMVSLSSACQINNPNGVDLAKLRDYYVEQAVSGEGILDVYTQPTEVIYRELPGFYIDSSAKVEDSNGTITTRSDHYIVTDEVTNLLYDSESTDVQGTDNAKYTRYGATYTEVSNTEQGATVVITIESHIEKPAIAPKAFFIRKVKEGVLEAYKNNVSKSMNRISNLQR